MGRSFEISQCHLWLPQGNPQLSPPICVHKWQLIVNAGWLSIELHPSVQPGFVPPGLIASRLQLNTKCQPEINTPHDLLNRGGHYFWGFINPGLTSVAMWQLLVVNHGSSTICVRLDLILSSDTPQNIFMIIMQSVISYTVYYVQ
jgi:hypothetical protein